MPALKFALAAILSLFLSAIAGTAHSQDRKPPVKKYAPEYEKMKTYLLKNLNRASLMEKVAIGLLLLADGRHAQELKTCLDSAKEAKKYVGSSNWSNWYIGFGAVLLSEYYIRFPGEDVKIALEQLMERAAPEQEPTGGWFSKTGVAKKANYSSEDHGQLTCMIYSALLIMNRHKLKIPAGMLEKVEAYSIKQCSREGITYGTGNPWGDLTGSRGGFALRGLSYAGRTDHKIYTIYPDHYPKCFDRLEQGHHIGGWHFMGCILGCFSLDSDLLGSLQAKALPKYVPRIDSEGGFYLGDDQASGGEKELMGHNYCSTAALAILIALQDPKAFKVAPPPSSSGGTSSSRPTERGASPFSQKNMGKPKETPDEKK